MGYYRGDMTGHYRGDPGFFGFLGKIAKGAANIALGTNFSLASKAKVPTPSLGGSGTTSALAKLGGLAKMHPVMAGAGVAALGALGIGAGMKMHGTRVHPLTGQIMGRRHRRMHVTNVRALRRAIRRAKGFEKLARRVMSFTSPHKPRGHAFFKSKKRKRI